LKKFSLLLFVMIFILSSILLTGCKSAEERAVLSTVRTYVKLWNEEDAGGVFEITHQKTRTMGYKNQLDLQFAVYNVKFKLEDYSFDKIEDGYAYVPFVATMIKTDDSDFQNVRITGTFVLEMENDEWKILQLMATNVENLN
jgi:hypothetical protein